MNMNPHSSISLSRPAPPLIALRDRHPLDVDPLAFPRQRWRPPRTTCALGPPPRDCVDDHRPAVLDQVLAEVRERMCDPIRPVPGATWPAFEWRCMLRFHHRPDGSAVAFDIEHRGPCSPRRNHVDEAQFEVDRIGADREWSLAVRRLVELRLQGDPTRRGYPSKVYVDWVLQRVKEVLSAEGLWRELPPGTPELLGFDPSLLAIARRIRTHPWAMPGTLLAYNQVAKHRDEFRRLDADNPSLHTLYAAFRDDERFPAQGEPIARLRRFLARFGISPALWRRIAAPGCGERFLPAEEVGFNAPDQVMRSLLAADMFGPEFDPPRWLIAPLVAEWESIGVRMFARRPRLRPALRRIALLQQRATPRERDLMVNTAPAVIGWLVELGGIDARIARRATWSGLFDAAMGERSAHGGRLHRWTSPFARLVVEKHDVVALADSDALRDEGRAMRHCIETYVERCRQGHGLVFSIRAPDENRTRWTASFEGYDGSWRLDSVRGYRNAMPTDEVTRLCHAIASRLNGWRAT